MLRGIYTSASGMLVEQKRMDVTANNLANVNTTGFKKETAISGSFQELLVRRVNDKDAAGNPQTASVGTLGLGTFLVQNAARLSAASLKETGNPLDVAITGDGFFTVQTPQGIRYTRQGNFTQDANGTLVTAEGHAVLAGGRPITVRDGSLTISNTGEVRNGDRLLGRLDIATSQALGSLRKEGHGLWTRAGADDAPLLITPAEANGQYQLRVGFLEASNVESVTEMVEMITIMRSYEANQRTLQVQDETLQKAANDIGRVSG